MFSENNKTQLFVAWAIVVCLVALAIGINSVSNWIVVAAWRSCRPWWREAFGALLIRPSPKASAMLADSLERRRFAGERLERMKSEFLAAQQRRRERAPDAAARPDDTDDGPLMAGPADETLTGIAAVRP